MEQRMQLRPVPSGAQRRPENPRTSPARKRLPAEVRQQLLNAIYSGQQFRTVLRDIGLTSNQVWGLTKTDEYWATALEAALMATRRDDIQDGTNAAYVHGCVCRECREHQWIRMARASEVARERVSAPVSDDWACWDSSGTEAACGVPPPLIVPIQNDGQ